MKKFLLAITLSLISFSSFSAEKNSNMIVKAHIADICHIYSNKDNISKCISNKIYTKKTRIQKFTYSDKIQYDYQDTKTDFTVVTYTYF